MSDLQMTNQDLSQRQSMEELANQLTLADHLVYKKYLPELQNYPLVEPSEEMKRTLDVKTCIKLFQMKKLTLKKARICFKNSPPFIIPAWPLGAVWL
jgi:hypothetical protein